MKKITSIYIVLLLCCTDLFAQNVVFDITSKDTTDHRMVLRWAKEFAELHPESSVEVVFYGKSLDMISKDKSFFAEGITNATKNPHITFKVCEIAMKKNNIDKSQLVAGVGTVPDGIFELVSKQKDGWGYIKVSH